MSWLLQHRQGSSVQSHWSCIRAEPSVEMLTLCLISYVHECHQGGGQLYNELLAEGRCKWWYDHSHRFTPHRQVWRNLARQMAHFIKSFGFLSRLRLPNRPQKVSASGRQNLEGSPLSRPIRFPAAALARRQQLRAFPSSERCCLSRFAVTRALCRGVH